MKWCLEHFDVIDKAIRRCLATDQEVWKFYGDDVIEPGSPSRTQYFWAAKILTDWLPEKTGLPLREAILKSHSWPASEFSCFSF